MLSEQGYQIMKQQLQNIPDEIQGKKRANLRQNLKRKIKEHEYARTYERFEPLPHIPYFINRITNEKTLRSIIRTASSIDEITIDTESVNIRGEGNIPALIQLQLILPNRPSIIMIVEMYHLPRENRPEFSLIKELFQTVFLPEKTSYIFGSKDELIPFIRFKLFTIEQVKSMKFIDLQKNFKRYWNEQHPHQQINSTNNTSIINCICEFCIKQDPSNTWSLQDCVAYQLNQYLPKIYSQSAFNMGLDPNLYRRNSMELEHRKNISEYAFNDCLSMEIIIRQMKMKKFKFNYGEQTHNRPDLIELSPISSDDNNDDDIFAYTKIKTNRKVSIITRNNNQKRNSNEDEEILSNNKKQKNLNNLTKNNELELIPNKLSLISNTPSIDKGNLSKSNRKKNVKENNWNTNSSNTNPLPNVSTTEQQFTGQTSNQLDVIRTNLTQTEKKKIHNRTCTIKQRRRCYQHEIVKRDIDNRFSITNIKRILKQLNISFNLVNKSTSSNTNKTSLFIGIKNSAQMNIYERITSKLFSTDHYHEFIRERRRQNRHEHRLNPREKKKKKEKNIKHHIEHQHDQ